MSAPGAALARLALGRILILTLLAAVLCFGAWHYWTLATSLRHARAELLTIRGEMIALDPDVTETQLAEAEIHLQRADNAIATAKTHYRRDPLLRVAAALPVLGTQVRAAGDLIEIASLSVAIADEATAAGHELVAVREGRAPDEPLAQTFVDAIEETRPRIKTMDRLSSQLLEQRIELGDGALLPPLASARDQLDAELPALVDAIGKARGAYDVIPGLLGFNGERHYLVLALNNGELLPGGGLVSAAGVLPVNHGETGEVDFTDSTRWKQEWEALGGAYIEPPGPLRRYLLRDYTWNLLVSNWDPDFPTWSQQALQLYELVHGEQDVDGVVALDLEVLRRLLAVVGPQTLDVEGYGPVTFTPDNAILELERLTRQSFEPSADRKSVVGDLAQVLLDDIKHVPSDRWGELARVVRDLGAERHLQFLSFDGREQAVVRDVGWSGALQQTTADYVHFNEASVNSTKLNLIVQPEGEYSVDVSALGDARHSLTLHYKNSLPEWQRGKDPKLVQQLMLGGTYGGYLRVFGPASMTNWSATADGAPLSIEDTDEQGGRRWFGVFVSLPSGSRADPTLNWTVPLATRAFEAKEYELLVQKQAGFSGLCLQLSVTREGVPPSSLEIHGGSRDARGRVCLTTDVTVKAVWQ